MKRIVLPLFFVLITIKASCQFPDNRLYIDAGVHQLQPLGASEDEEGYTLFPNYDTGPGFFVAGKYELRKHLLVGGRIGFAQFSTHQFEQDLLMVNPSSSVLQFSLIGGYKLDLSKWLSAPLQLQALAEVGIANHKLRVEGFRIFSDNPLATGKEFDESDISGSMTLQLSYSFGLKYEGFISAGYQFINADHVLYQDQSFQFFSTAVGITLKLMHNKLYRFER